MSHEDFPKPSGESAAGRFNIRSLFDQLNEPTLVSIGLPLQKKINQNLETDEHIQAQRHLNMKLIF